MTEPRRSHLGGWNPLRWLALILAGVLPLAMASCGGGTPEVEVAEEEPDYFELLFGFEDFDTWMEATDPIFERREEIEGKLAEMDREDPATLPLIDEHFRLDMKKTSLIFSGTSDEPLDFFAMLGEQRPSIWHADLTDSQLEAVDRYIRETDDFPFEEGCASEYYARAGAALDERRRELERESREARERAAREASSPPDPSEYFNHVTKYWHGDGTHEMLRGQLEGAWRRDLKEIGYFVDPPDTSILLHYMKPYLSRFVDEEDMPMFKRHLSLMLRETHADGGQNALKMVLHTSVVSSYGDLLFGEQHEK